MNLLQMYLYFYIPPLLSREIFPPLACIRHNYLISHITLSLFNQLLLHSNEEILL